MRGYKGSFAFNGNHVPIVGRQKFQGFDFKRSKALGSGNHFSCIDDTSSVGMDKEETENVQVRLVCVHGAFPIPCSGNHLQSSKSSRSDGRGIFSMECTAMIVVVLPSLISRLGSWRFLNCLQSFHIFTSPIRVSIHIALDTT